MSDGLRWHLRIAGLWPEDPTDIIAEAFVAYVESKGCRCRRWIAINIDSDSGAKMMLCAVWARETSFDDDPRRLRTCNVTINNRANE
jgi:hypothetical protein